MLDRNIDNNNLAIEREQGFLSRSAGYAIAKVKNDIWIVGIPTWIFGVCDRGMAAFIDGQLTALKLSQLFITCFFFISWLYLKPDSSLGDDGVSAIGSYQENFNLEENHRGYLQSTQARMLALQDQHLVGQRYILPFSYLSQIYHLLNLKHLEKIHAFSLNNLKVTSVNYVDRTEVGGTIRFQTRLDSPFNILRMWREPSVEVDLTLHNPYTVELSIPVYGDKRIIVIFNVLPLSEKEHYFLLDIYSNLNWFKPLLRFILHIGAALTLFEDLPYLRQLDRRNLPLLIESNKVSQHETMQLFRIYAALHAKGVNPLAFLK
jgi:hypothetical protein